MNWKNAEQYPDRTAAEAMLRVMAGGPDRAGGPDDEGSYLLIEAIVRQAAEDYIRALRRSGRTAVRQQQEIESFFRSKYFRGLTGMNGITILRLIRKEADAE